MLTSILLTLLSLFKIALFIRVILDYIQVFARNWRPPTFLIAIFELIYGVTEKPLAFVRRFVPPLRLGGISLDLAFIVLWIAVGMLQNLVVIIL